MAEKSSEAKDANPTKVKLVAKGDLYGGNVACHHNLQSGRTVTDTDLQAKNTESYHFKSAQWSADGTCVITNSTDNHIRTFVIPPELLDERPEPLSLQPYSIVVNHESTDAVIPYPAFDLQDPSTTLVLSAVHEHPIRLNSALTADLVASYPLINPTTEAYIKPYCLAFGQHHDSHFIAGSDNLISIFDLSRPGQEPVSTYQTGPKRNKATWTNPAISIRGIVSALAIEPVHNVLAAGTLTRQIGLYEVGSSDLGGSCLGTFTLHDTAADQCIGGSGITQLLWSPCGRYLYVVERKSNGVSIYDIRSTGQLLCWLTGRKADTQQRLHVDIISTGNAGEHEIWAGGTDGTVRIWTNPHLSEGAVDHAFQHTAHDDALPGISLHPGGSVLATVSGQRHFHHTANNNQQTSNTTMDALFKIWSLH